VVSVTPWPRYLGKNAPYTWVSPGVCPDNLEENVSYSCWEANPESFFAILKSHKAEPMVMMMMMMMMMMTMMIMIMIIIIIIIIIIITEK
jgi:hypothetical protein